MNKLNPVVYQKLLLQAQEAKAREMKKLAGAVLNGLGPTAVEDKAAYSSTELKEDVYNGLWKLAFNVVGYHDLESADIEKLDRAIAFATDNFVKDIEQALEVEGKIGPNEPKLPGQS
jgi:hypothetical protein